VRTKLMNSQEAEQAMPLDRFIAETLDVFGTDVTKFLWKRQSLCEPILDLRSMPW
jgi:hypothetical protein